MKKIILTAIVAVASLGANAQIWVGGQLGFNISDREDLGEGKTTTFSIAPEVGYTLNDKFDLAIALRESNTSVKDGDSSNTFTVNPYARYTFFQTGKVGFFVDGGFSVGVQSFDGSDDNLTIWGIGIRPGVKYAASDKVTLVASFGGLGYQQAKCGDVSISDLGLNVDGNALQFGLYYSF
ncbi:MAG: outer membrane beta-barrel protein [Prevotellaceae bacterium]|nr:outer membrane beta-barrel protein [Prevotellaceae bacterium]